MACLFFSMTCLSAGSECQTLSLGWSKTRRDGVRFSPFGQLREVFRLPGPDNDRQPTPPGNAGEPGVAGPPAAGPVPAGSQQPGSDAPPVAWLDGSQPVADGPAPGLAWSYGLD